MTGRMAFLFPGQGSHLPGVLAGVAGAPAVRRALVAVDAVAVEYGHEPVSPLVLDPATPGLDTLLVDDPDRIQLAVYATSVALAALLADEYDVRPDVLFGHSFGEVAALTVAGALSVADGTRVVCERVSALRRAGLPDGGMLAVELSAARTEHLLAAVDDWDLALAGENAPRQSLVSGPVDRLSAFARAAEAIDVRVTRLRVPHAFHHPGQRAAADLFATALRDIPIAPPRLRFYSDVHDRFEDSPSSLRELLVEHLVRPVRFLTAMRALHSGGVARFVECGARAVLTGLLAQCLPPVTAVSPLRNRIVRSDLVVVLGGLSGTSSTPAPEHDGDGRNSSPFPEPSPPEEPDADRAAPVPAAAPVPVAQAPVLADLGTGDPIADQVRGIYAEVLEYPEDVLTDEVELEAELGVDSLKQAALLGQALEHFGVADRVQDVQPTGYPTIAAVADLVRDLTTRKTA
jgi:[acyl-carrier-protein] S-malonyltransferase